MQPHLSTCFVWTYSSCNCTVHTHTQKERMLDHWPTLHTLYWFSYAKIIELVATVGPPTSLLPRLVVVLEAVYGAHLLDCWWQFGADRLLSLLFHLLLTRIHLQSYTGRTRWLTDGQWSYFAQIGMRFFYMASFNVTWLHMQLIEVTWLQRASNCSALVMDMRAGSSHVQQREVLYRLIVRYNTLKLTGKFATLKYEPGYVWWSPDI